MRLAAYFGAMKLPPSVKRMSRMQLGHAIASLTSRWARKTMSALHALGFAAVAASATTATAAEPLVPLTDDATLRALTSQALEAEPELSAAKAAVSTAVLRTTASRGWPDPILDIGVQNDGFDRIRFGTAETSFVSIGASQTFPVSGRLVKQADVFRVDADAQAARVERVSLTVRAQVARAYLDLLLERDVLALLDRMTPLLKQTAAAANSKYESGRGSQVDLLRAKLEVVRLEVRRRDVAAAEYDALAELNRLRAQPPSTPVSTTATLMHLADPQLSTVAQVVARSPELAIANFATVRSQAESELARRMKFPDLTLRFAYMWRGDMLPMWAAGISAPIPSASLWQRGKELEMAHSAGVESTARHRAVELKLKSDAERRRVTLGQIHETNELYRGGVLPLSEAAAAAALNQYQVGEATFELVLAAQVDLLEDTQALLQSVVRAQKLAIADAEVQVAPGEAD